jgi:CBS domain containing-hemolysin-like protein
VWVLERLTVSLQKLSKASTDPTVTEVELISLAEHGAEEGTIEPDEKDMITRIFAFTDLRARDVMIPARKVFILDKDCTIEDALPKIVAHPYTRIPLRSGDSPDVVIEQVVYLRDVLSELYKGHKKKRLTVIAHDTPLFVTRNQPIEQLFETLRGHEERPVVVVDEFGALQGMFTLEDMLEELVGEIHDETNKAGRWVHEVKQGALVLKGTEKLRTVEEHLSAYLDGKPTDSVSHWILEHVEHIPRAGEQFTIDGVEVRIDKASMRRIQRVRLSCPSKVQSAEDDSTTADS